MSEPKGKIVNQTGMPREKELDFWEPVIFTKEDIDSEIERLADLDQPESGFRSSILAHPRAEESSLGLAPGIRVSLDVLRPGEQSRLFRHNATEVNFCIKGSGYTEIAGKKIEYGQYHVVNHPSYTAYRHVNDTDQVQARLTYSNIPLLQRLNVYTADENPPVMAAVEEDRGEEKGREDPKSNSPYGTFQLNEEGAWLMPYEVLINPQSVESKALHWPWEEVKQHLVKLEALGKDYVGRRLYMMYNPMTTRFNGCTPSFFATITIRPPKIVDRPHRHTSAAINYYFEGEGRSTVEGKVYEWKAGDLMLSAPGWATHNHASYDEYVYELTVQDQPLHLFMESLIWQEDLKLPAALLGSSVGFGTNRSAATAAE